MGAADGGIADSAEATLEVGCLFPQLLERFVLHSIFALHLFDEKLRVGHDFQLSDAQLRRSFQTGDEAAVFGNVVRRGPNRLAFRGQHVSVFRFDDVAVRGGAWISTGAAVREQLRLHSNAYTSNAGSSYG